MKNIFYIITVGIFVGLLAFVGMIQVAYAETRIGGESVVEIDEDTFWSIEGSPYIVSQDIIVNQGATLTVGPGVEVRGSEAEIEGSISVAGGKFIVQGSNKNRSLIHGLRSIYVGEEGSMVLENTDVYDMDDAVYLYGSRAVIATSTIKDSTRAIYIKRGALSMWGSQIISNKEGILIQGVVPFQVRSEERYETGGIGNALEDIPLGKTFVSVIGSVISGNQFFAVDNRDYSSVAHMVDNWWGNTRGPGMREGDSVLGEVEYEPWLAEDPFVIEEAHCCSSVLFLPGLQASRLYQNTSGLFGIGSSIDRLWEPNQNGDVQKLFLTTTGSSTDASIYVGEPIDRGLGVTDIYGSFMGYLDGLRSSGVIGEWKSYSYDWRKPIAEVVAGRERRATTSDSLIETLESLAARSRTGKVSIVAHSNGGLVAKYLVKTLSDRGKADLIDTVISVAVPYLGTPQAILGLLHGDNQSIGEGVILRQSVARELGVNMATAYSLLPSREYFSRILGPTIAFAATTTIGINDGAYPTQIGTFDVQKSFIIDQKNSRTVTVSSKTTLPIEGNQFLVNAADVLHAVIDPFMWPQTIARWAIVGWGNRTAKGVIYSEKTVCRGPGSRAICDTEPVYTASTTLLGDGTVILPSAAYQAGNVVSIDLSDEEVSDGKNIKHATILGAASTQKAIGTILGSEVSDGVTRVETDTETIDKISQIPGVTLGEPDYSQKGSFLVVSTHSPVNLHLYDAQGNHTGIRPPPSDLVFEEGDEELDEDLYTFYDEEIPGSSFEIREGYEGNETYITLNEDDTETYSVVIDGVGVGTFDYQVEHIQGDSVVERVEYLGLPVNPLTVATGTVTIGDWGSMTSDQYATPLASTTPLTLDVDGNGTTDIVPKPGSVPDLITQCQSLKKAVIVLIGKEKRSKDIIRRIDRMEDLARKNKLNRVQNQAEKLKKRVVHKKLNRLSVQEKNTIVDLIETFIAQYE